MTESVGLDYQAEVSALLKGSNRDPHAFLGRHPVEGGWEVRAFHPAAERAVLVSEQGETRMEREDQRGLFLGYLPGYVGYRVRFHAGEDSWEVDDPYRFQPTLGDLDLHLIGEGTHGRLWQALGARVIDHQGTPGTAFSLWAPNASAVRLVSDATFWNNGVHFMRTLGTSGIWEIFVPGLGAGVAYKYEVVQRGGRVLQKADPLARAAELAPGTASIVTASSHAWDDHGWIAARGEGDFDARPMSIYEVHIGSWRRRPDGESLSYREAAPELADYCQEMGFTHVEFMPLAEHPFGGSWGYQVTGYYAPTSRYGSPDDLRFLIDTLHRRGIGVLIDWVPAHFPKDEWALARFDGTALYEHSDPRLGEHPDWGTLVFNHGRNEVRNFLVSNARYWIEEFHVDGLRVDAVASMLYLDYSREHDQWVPNRYGGRENLEAVAMLREVTQMVAVEFPGALTIAEESTAWPGVSRPAEMGGLGFSRKWNMGWMHDTLDYFRHDPVYRRYHHHELTFGLIYAWSERFILPLSHDEVVHGKGSLLGKQPGDEWRRFANLRAMLAWMWAHPGNKLLFMGGEIGQQREWSHERSIDWQLLEEPRHAGAQRLVRDLNRAYLRTPALWQRDFTSDGFSWLDAGNADQNVASFLRYDASGRCGLVCVANFSPEVRLGFRVGLPSEGSWREVLNSDAETYGGTNTGNLGGVTAERDGWHGQHFSAAMTLPPMGVLWLTPGDPGIEEKGKST
ncbi:MAG: 1,4-alpha-glucan branching protein GlgB [Candidatus Dormibacteraeota bacterium]|nr:1,4-alpha-glucan branching protein GlgB [Candidatus Dormibacteraeota bacterium]